MPTKYKTRKELMDDKLDLQASTLDLKGDIKELKEENERLSNVVRLQNSQHNPQSIAHEAVKTFKLGLIKSMMD